MPASNLRAKEEAGRGYVTSIRASPRYASTTRISNLPGMEFARLLRSSIVLTSSTGESVDLRRRHQQMRRQFQETVWKARRIRSEVIW
jgi:hypothetical protein